MRYRPLALAALAAAGLPAHAAIDVASTTFSYSQSFDTLTTITTPTPWVNDSTLAGWSLFIANGTAATTYAADTGSSNAGSFRSFGAAGASDRALGSLASGGTYFGSPATGDVAGWIAVAFTNTSSQSLSGFTLGYSGEQWRNGGNTTAQSLVLQYGYGGSFASVANWATPGGAFDFTSPIATTTAAAVNGNGAGLVTGLGGSIATTWSAGDTLWLRWADANDLGNDHGLAIDNMSLTVSGSVAAVPEPGTYALLLAGLAAVGFIRNRRHGAGAL